MPSKWVARFTPKIPLNGITSQLPAKPPTFMSEMTNEVSCFVNRPVGNVLFSFSSSSKLIDAQPVDNPNDSVNKLPKFQMASNFNLVQCNIPL